MQLFEIISTKQLPESILNLCFAMCLKTNIRYYLNQFFINSNTSNAECIETTKQRMSYCNNTEQKDRVLVCRTGNILCAETVHSATPSFLWLHVAAATACTTRTQPRLRHSKTERTRIHKSYNNFFMHSAYWKRSNKWTNIAILTENNATGRVSVAVRRAHAGPALTKTKTS